MKPDKETFDKSWRSAVSVVKVERRAVDAMIKQHYIGKWPGVCVLVLAMTRDDVALGVIVFALPPRETTKRYGGETWELARLWMNDSVPQNGETYFISKAIKYIRHNFPAVKVLVSYADPSAGHEGVIYRAANWLCDGRTDQDRKTPRFDYVNSITGKKYSRKGHVPAGTQIQRLPRISKHRFYYPLN